MGKWHLTDNGCHLFQQYKREARICISVHSLRDAYRQEPQAARTVASPRAAPVLGQPTPATASSVVEYPATPLLSEPRPLQEPLPRFLSGQWPSGVLRAGRREVSASSITSVFRPHSGALHTPTVGICDKRRTVHMQLDVLDADRHGILRRDRPRSDVRDPQATRPRVPGAKSQHTGESDGAIQCSRS